MAAPDRSEEIRICQIELAAIRQRLGQLGHGDDMTLAKFLIDMLIEELNKKHTLQEH